MDTQRPATHLELRGQSAVALERTEAVLCQLNFEVKVGGKGAFGAEIVTFQGGECLSFPKRTRHKDGRQQQRV